MKAVLLPVIVLILLFTTVTSCLLCLDQLQMNERLRGENLELSKANDELLQADSKLKKSDDDLEKSCSALNDQVNQMLNGVH